MTLPSGASLTQGILDLELTIGGPVDRLTIEGPIALAKAKLTGFDLTEKMGAVASLAGVKRVGDTLIDSLTGTLHMTPEGIRIRVLQHARAGSRHADRRGDDRTAGHDGFPDAGEAERRSRGLADSVGGDHGVLSYTQKSGVPFRIQGTTKNPQFVPDVGRAMKGATDSLKDAAKDPDNIKKATDALSNFFRKKE